MEIVLVDDGSTDASGKICDDYAVKDERIYVIHQSNQGIIATKKVALRECQGKYVMFVDSDDWVEPELLEKMVQAIMESGCSLVCTDVYQDLEDGTAVECRNAIPSGIYETDTIAKDLFYYKDTERYGILPYSVAKLYSANKLKEIIGNISSDIHFAEDKAIVFSLVFKNIKVCFTDDICYHYCIRNGSVCQSENPDYLVELTAIYKYIKKFFDTHKERGHLLWQLGKWLSIEAGYAINGKLGLTVAGRPIYTEPYKLDSSVFLMQKKKIILYGAGKVGSDYRKQFEDCMNIELCGWVDKNYEKYQEKEFDVQPVEHIQKADYDYILVAVKKQTIFQEIKEELTEMGVEENAIIWGRPYGAPYENA